MRIHLLLRRPLLFVNPNLYVHNFLPCMMPKASEQLRGCLCIEAEREADDCHSHSSESLMLVELVVF